MTEIEARSAILALRQKVREHQETERRLHQFLAEKETLLREVYHRVRNNLQAVETLLTLQIRQTPAVAENLQDLRHRVYCLGMVHQRLMQAVELETTNWGDFLRDLCQALAAVNTAQRDDVTLNVTVEPHDAAIKLDLAMPLGLLITELVTNAYKHAFPSDQHGTIDVSLTILGEGKARLVVSDNGIGMPAGPEPVTIGQHILAALVDELNAEITVHQNQGTDIFITFPCPPELPC
jgi:two-component sensor histidine kinase